MKKIFLVLAFASLLFACKKESSKPTSPTIKTPTTVEDTTKKTVDSVSCVDNPKINFSCVGTPVGKLSYCIKDIDGNVYKTVIIGKQQWMAENLKVSKYNDGTVIPNVKDSLDWIKLSTGAWCYMKNDSSYNELYGKLYNWYVVGQKTIDNKNVCPIGWHVPTSTEWNELIDYLGGGNLAGDKMKEVGNASWKIDNWGKSVSNTSLFTATTSGSRSVGKFYEEKIATWWSTTEANEKEAKEVDISHYVPFAFKEYHLKNTGKSIRCLKD